MLCNVCNNNNNNNTNKHIMNPGGSGNTLHLTDIDGWMKIWREKNCQESETTFFHHVKTHKHIHFILVLAKQKISKKKHWIKIYLFHKTFFFTNISHFTLSMINDHFECVFVIGFEKSSSTFSWLIWLSVIFLLLLLFGKNWFKK